MPLAVSAPRAPAGARSPSNRKPRGATNQRSKERLSISAKGSNSAPRMNKFHKIQFHTTQAEYRFFPNSNSNSS